MYSRLNSDQPVLSKIWVLLMYLASFRLVGVGIFNEAMAIIHYVFAIFAFGGYGLGMIHFLGMMLHRSYLGILWPNVRFWGILYGIVIISMIYMISELLRVGIGTPSDLNFVEWVATFTIAFWLGGMAILGDQASAS